MKPGDRFVILLALVGFLLVVASGVLGTVRAGDSTIFPTSTQSAGH